MTPVQRRCYLGLVLKNFLWGFALKTVRKILWAGGCLVTNLDVQLCPPLSLGSPSALSCHNEKLTRVTKSKTVLLHGIFSVKRVSCCRREEASPGENSCSFHCSPAHVGDEHAGSTQHLHSIFWCAGHKCQRQLQVNCSPGSSELEHLHLSHA